MFSLSQQTMSAIKSTDLYDPENPSIDDDLDFQHNESNVDSYDRVSGHKKSHDTESDVGARSSSGDVADTPKSTQVTAGCTSTSYADRSAKKSGSIEGDASTHADNDERCDSLPASDKAVVQSEKQSESSILHVKSLLTTPTIVWKSTNSSQQTDVPNSSRAVSSEDTVITHSAAKPSLGVLSPRIWNLLHNFKHLETLHSTKPLCDEATAANSETAKLLVVGSCSTGLTDTTCSTTDSVTKVSTADDRNLSECKASEEHHTELTDQPLQNQSLTSACDSHVNEQTDNVTDIAEPAEPPAEVDELSEFSQAPRIIQLRRMSDPEEPDEPQEPEEPPLTIAEDYAGVLLKPPRIILLDRDADKGAVQSDNIAVPPVSPCIDAGSDVFQPTDDEMEDRVGSEVALEEKDEDWQGGEQKLQSNEITPPLSPDALDPFMDLEQNHSSLLMKPHAVELNSGTKSKADDDDTLMSQNPLTVTTCAEAVTNLSSNRPLDSLVHCRDTPMSPALSIQSKSDTDSDISDMSCASETAIDTFNTDAYDTAQPMISDAYTANVQSNVYNCDDISEGEIVDDEEEEEFGVFQVPMPCIAPPKQKEKETNEKKKEKEANEKRKETNEKKKEKEANEKRKETNEKKKEKETNEKRGKTEKKQKKKKTKKVCDTNSADNVEGHSYQLNKDSNNEFSLPKPNRLFSETRRSPVHETRWSPVSTVNDYGVAKNLLRRNAVEEMRFGANNQTGTMPRREYRHGSTDSFFATPAYRGIATNRLSPDRPESVRSSPSRSVMRKSWSRSSSSSPENRLKEHGSVINRKVYVTRRPLERLRRERSAEYFSSPTSVVAHKASTRPKHNAPTVRAWKESAPVTVPSRQKRKTKWNERTDSEHKRSKAKKRKHSSEGRRTHHKSDVKSRSQTRKLKHQKHKRRKHKSPSADSRHVVEQRQVYSPSPSFEHVADCIHTDSRYHPPGHYRSVVMQSDVPRRYLHGEPFHGYNNLRDITVTAYRNSTTPSLYSETPGTFGGHMHFSRLSYSGYRNPEGHSSLLQDCMKSRYGAEYDSNFRLLSRSLETCLSGTDSDDVKIIGESRASDVEEDDTHSTLDAGSSGSSSDSSSDSDSESSSHAVVAVSSTTLSSVIVDPAPRVQQPQVKAVRSAQQKEKGPHVQQPQAVRSAQQKEKGKSVPQEPTHPKELMAPIPVIKPVQPARQESAQQVPTHQQEWTEPAPFLKPLESTHQKGRVEPATVVKPVESARQKEQVESAREVEPQERQMESAEARLLAKALDSALSSESTLPAPRVKAVKPARQKEQVQLAPQPEQSKPPTQLLKPEKPKEATVDIALQINSVEPEEPQVTLMDSLSEMEPIEPLPQVEPMEPYASDEATGGKVIDFIPVDSFCNKTSSESQTTDVVETPKVVLSSKEVQTQDQDEAAGEEDSVFHGKTMVTSSECQTTDNEATTSTLLSKEVQTQEVQTEDVVDNSAFIENAALADTSCQVESRTFVEFGIQTQVDDDIRDEGIRSPSPIPTDITEAVSLLAERGYTIHSPEHHSSIDTANEHMPRTVLLERKKATPDSPGQDEDCSDLFVTVPNVSKSALLTSMTKTIALERVSENNNVDISVLETDDDRSAANQSVADANTHISPMPVRSPICSKLSDVPVSAFSMCPATKSALHSLPPTVPHRPVRSQRTLPMRYALSPIKRGLAMNPNRQNYIFHPMPGSSRPVLGVSHSNQPSASCGVPFPHTSSPAIIVDDDDEDDSDAVAVVESSQEDQNSVAPDTLLFAQRSDRIPGICEDVETDFRHSVRTDAVTMASRIPPVAVQLQQSAGANRMTNPQAQSDIVNMLSSQLSSHVLPPSENTTAFTDSPQLDTVAPVLMPLLETIANCLLSIPANQPAPGDISAPLSFAPTVSSAQTHGVNVTSLTAEPTSTVTSTDAVSAWITSLPHSTTPPEQNSFAAPKPPLAVLDFDVDAVVSPRSDECMSFSPPSSEHMMAVIRMKHPAGMRKRLTKKTANGLKNKTKAAATQKTEEKLTAADKEAMMRRVSEQFKLIMQPYYRSGKITKEEYKDIMRKAVPSICHSRSRDASKVRMVRFADAYVHKVLMMRKYIAKKNQEQNKTS